MKLLPYIFILFILMGLFSCKSPLDIDIDRSVDTIYDPNNKPAEIELTPQNIHYEYSYMNELNQFSIKIRNISSSIVNINQIKSNDSDLNLEGSFEAFDLSPKNSQSAEKTLNFIYNPTKLGIIHDTIKFNDFKKPYLIMNTIVPTVYGKDLKFADTKVNGYSGAVLKLVNDGDIEVWVNEFNLVDENGVFFNQPKVDLPFKIEAHSSTGVILNFNPNKNNTFNAYVKYKCNSNGIVDDSIRITGKSY